MPNLSRRSWLFLRHLNLFPSIPPSIDEADLRMQRLSTRLFVVLLTLSITILAGYSLLVRVTRTINVKAPSFTQYSHLDSTYSQSLTCPCSQISVDYAHIFHVQYILHEVCSSAFVTDAWIKSLSPPDIGERVLNVDFRATATSTFQALRSFCQLSNQTISEALTQFNANQYITITVTPVGTFQSEMRAIFENFVTSVTNSFRRSLEAVQDISHVNTFWSAHLTNFQLLVRADLGGLFINPTAYADCSCSWTALCGDQDIIWPDINTWSSPLPGLYRGCFITRALLRSTLECFYNTSCIGKLQSYFTYNSSTYFPPLRSSPSSRYANDSKIQAIVNQMMVEVWNWSAIHEGYYNRCQPAACIYTFSVRNDALYIATTLFGLVGGLITTLRLCIPIAVKCGQKLRGLIRGANGKMHSF